MKTIFVDIENKVVTIDNETCSFYESGLYINDDSQLVDGNYPPIIDKDDIEEHLIEKHGKEIEIIFHD